MTMIEGLTEMVEGVLANDLLNYIFSFYRREMEEWGDTASESEYQAGKAALSGLLNEKQKETLSQMENLAQENLKYGLHFAFQRGEYTGFQQFFSEKSLHTPFHTLVTNQIVIMPQMAQHTDYFERRKKLNQCYTALQQQLEEAAKESLLSVYSVWDDRLYGILRHAFYLGYRYALSIIGEVEPIGATSSIVGKILLTEHELGLTFTLEELEFRGIQK